MGPADWQRIERSPSFRELVARRRRFVLPATAFFLAWYLGFILLSGYAEGFMGESIYEGFTVGYAFALSQFLMVAVLSVAYLRYSQRVLDPLRERVVRENDGGRPAEDRERRFDRPPGAGAPRRPTPATRREVTP